MSNCVWCSGKDEQEPGAHHAVDCVLYRSATDGPQAKYWAQRLSERQWTRERQGFGYSYSCPLHGRFREHSHHCPSCIESARSLLEDIHRESADRWLLDVVQHCFTLINHGIDMEGRIVVAKLTPPAPRGVFLTVGKKGTSFNPSFGLRYGCRFTFSDSHFCTGRGPGSLPHEIPLSELGRVEIEAL